MPDAWRRRSASRYPNTTVSTVINRHDGNAEIGQRDVEKAVGGSIAHQFPSDYRRALTAMHKGRPLALDNHNQLSASLTALARELAGVEREKTRSRLGRPQGIPLRPPVGHERRPKRN